MHFGHVENDRCAGGGREDQNARLKGSRQGQEIHHRVAEKGEEKQLADADQIDDGSGKQLAEGDRRQSNSQNDHAKGRGHVAEQSHAACNKVGDEIAHAEEIQKEACYKAEHTGIEDRGLEGHVFFVSCQAEYAHGEDQDVHGDDVDRRVAHDLGIFGKERFDDGKPEEAHVAQNRSDGEDAVLGIMDFLSEEKIDQPHKGGLEQEGGNKEPSHIDHVRYRKIKREERGDGHARAADIDQHTREGRQMVGHRPPHLADEEAGEYVEKGNDNVG